MTDLDRLSALISQLKTLEKLVRRANQLFIADELESVVRNLTDLGCIFAGEAALREETGK